MPAPHKAIGDFDLWQIVTAPPYYENCYLVKHRDSGDAVLIDPGSSARLVLDTAANAGADVKAILLTHGHPDHVGAVQAIVEALDIPVYAHKDEAVILDAADEWGKALLGQPIPLPEITYFDGEPTLDLLGGVRVIETPGHTPGGVCFSFNGFSLTGDTIFDHGLGRTDFPGGSAPQLAASISRFLKEVQPQDLLYSGHGNAWTVESARSWWADMGAHMA